MIDDQPEVTIDDPAFLFDNNDGFQEVTSKKTQKIKLKQEAEQQKKTEQQTQQQKKRDSSNKVCALYADFTTLWAHGFIIVYASGWDGTFGWIIAGKLRAVSVFFLDKFFFLCVFNGIPCCCFCGVPCCSRRNF